LDTSGEREGKYSKNTVVKRGKLGIFSNTKGGREWGGAGGGAGGGGRPLSSWAFLTKKRKRSLPFGKLGIPLRGPRRVAAFQTWVSVPLGVPLTSRQTKVGESFHKE